MEEKPVSQDAAELIGEASESSRPRLKKPVKPDVEEHKAVIHQLLQEMQKRRAKMEEIKQLLDQKRQSGGSPETSRARAKLTELSSGFKAELEKKKALREELQAVNKQRDGLRAKLRDLKAKVGSYGTVQKIDEKITSLDYRINHYTLDLKEETRTRDEIKKLVALKPLVGSYAQEEESLKATDGTRQQVLDHLKACDERLNGIKGEEEKQRALVNELRGKEAAKTQDVPSLAKERDECREVMNALWQKVQELREEHRARHNQYWDEQQAWQRQQQEERRLKQTARDKEYAERDAARKAAAAEYAGEPYHKEIGLCEQLISHLSKYSHSNEAHTPSTAQSTAPGGADVFEGMKAVRKRGEDEKEEGFGVFYGSGSKKGKNKKGKPGVGSQGSVSDQKLNHSLDMIDAFSKLKVTMPSTASKVPDALKEVEERKAYWLKKRADAAENGIVISEEDGASSSKASKAAPKPKANGVLDFSTEEWPDFAGNVDKGPAATPAASEASGLVAVKLAVEGGRVSVVCIPTA